MNKIDEKAKALYEKEINNHPTIHCNRFRSWEDLNVHDQDEYRIQITPEPEHKAVETDPTPGWVKYEIQGRGTQSTGYHYFGIYDLIDYDDDTVAHFIVEEDEPWAKYAERYTLFIERDVKVPRDRIENEQQTVSDAIKALDYKFETLTEQLANYKD